MDKFSQMFSEFLNLNELRVFSRVYQKSSMTLAAQSLHLTQSGVSQHIASLERSLGVQLFDRLNKKLYPTPAGRNLFETCKKSFNNLEHTIQEIKGATQSLIGTIHIGMPQQFGANIIAPLLGKFSKTHPSLKFDLRFEYSQNIVRELQKGEIDIGFIDAFYTSALLDYSEVYSETLDLVVQKDLLKPFGKIQHEKNYYEKLSFIDYEADNPLVLKWFAHHLGTDKLRLNYRAFVPSTGGIASLIATGMGAGIIPAHVTKLIKTDADLHVFKGRSSEPLKNSIYIASLQGRTLSPSVQALRDWLVSELCGRGVNQV